MTARSGWRGTKYEKAPIGVVVDGAEKPAEHEPSLFERLSVPGRGTTNFNSRQSEAQPTIFIVQPPGANHDDTRDTLPDWYTICIAIPAVKRKILSVPGFLQPLNRPPEPRHKIANSPVAGFGVFALTDLELGDLVFSERALLTHNPEIFKPMKFPAHYTKDHVMQAALRDKERTFEVAFKMMPKEIQEEYMALHNCHLHDGSGPLHGVFRTNCLGIEGYYDSIEYPFSYAGVFKEVSRINHSCSPNVRNFFNRQTFGVEMRALRNIKKGEEISICYTDITESTAERQASLAPYGFQCECRACRESKKSDLLRIKLVKNDPQTISGRRLVMWLMNTELPEDYVVDPCLERLRAIEEGGLEGSKWYGSTIKYLFRVYCAMGNASEAFKYRRKQELILSIESATKPKSDAELWETVYSDDWWNWKDKVKQTMKYFRNPSYGGPEKGLGSKLAALKVNA